MLDVQLTGSYMLVQRTAQETRVSRSANGNFLDLFDTVPSIQPNYIRTLELTLAWLFEAFPQSETALSAGKPNQLGERYSRIRASS